MAAEQSQVADSNTLTPLSDYQFSGNKFTVERKCAFIHALREYGSIFHAAQAIGCSRRAVYDWIEDDPQFSEAVSDIREDNYDDLETSVYKRAFKSDLLAMFYLKAHRPKFRDKVQIDVVQVQDEIDGLMSKLSSDDRLRLQPAMTEFIDTSYSESTSEYQPVTGQTLQFSPASEQSQKEESPSDLSDSHS